MVTELNRKTVGLSTNDGNSQALFHALPTSENGWCLRPFQIVSLLDMKGYDYRQLCSMLTALSYVERPTGADNPFDKNDLELLEALRFSLTELHLSKSLRLVERIEKEFANSQRTKREFGKRIETLHERIGDELDDLQFMYLPLEMVEYYRDKPLFGEQVADKFGKATTDIQEAGKCFATGRYTACVFHLMRVMEFAVQYLGKKLNISLVSEKNWAVILDQVDRAIKALPTRNTSQKRRRNKFAESSAHLRMVKDAWRNDVMHPKETYTDEEAERVFRNVKDFMVHLATKL